MLVESMHMIKTCSWSAGINLTHSDPGSSSTFIALLLRPGVCWCVLAKLSNGSSIVHMQPDADDSDMIVCLCVNMSLMWSGLTDCPRAGSQKRDTWSKYGMRERELERARMFHKKNTICRKIESIEWSRDKLRLCKS